MASKFGIIEAEDLLLKAEVPFAWAPLPHPTVSEPIGVRSTTEGNGLFPMRKPTGESPADVVGESSSRLKASDIILSHFINDEALLKNLVED